MIRWIRRVLIPALKPQPVVAEPVDYGDDPFCDPEHFYLMASASDMAQKIRAARKAEAEAAARQQPPDTTAQA